MLENPDYIKQLEEAKVVVNGIEMIPFTTAKLIVESILKNTMDETVNSISTALEEYTKAINELNKITYDSK